MLRLTNQLVFRVLNETKSIGLGLRSALGVLALLSGVVTFAINSNQIGLIVDNDVPWEATYGNYRPVVRGLKGKDGSITLGSDIAVDDLWKIMSYKNRFDRPDFNSLLEVNGVQRGDTLIEGTEVIFPWGEK